jgi:hypothetical protein
MLFSKDSQRLCLIKKNILQRFTIERKAALVLIILQANITKKAVSSWQNVPK